MRLSQFCRGPRDDRAPRRRSRPRRRVADERPRREAARPRAAPSGDRRALLRRIARLADDEGDRRRRGRHGGLDPERSRADGVRRHAGRRDHQHERARALGGARPAALPASDADRERGFARGRVLVGAAGGGGVMLAFLKRHPLPMQAFFDWSLVVTYAFPEAVLQPLLPPGLVLDGYEGSAFLAIAMVQTRAMRPVGLPRAIGRDFFLSGYRVFTR